MASIDLDRVALTLGVSTDGALLDGLDHTARRLQAAMELIQVEGSTLGDSDGVFERELWQAVAHLEQAHERVRLMARTAEVHARGEY